ncbi:unnamed protein product [Adineta ricciae]|uniref:Uncharacterized protein n=1 Tax=Adineta ricciae TaxID=249248 RepID=A0A814LP65_ADIRI|nr:unnamed protein product [Adineta ricciae]CAF1068113.1 unnamed protein product [Adineta ricciae]
MKPNSGFYAACTLAMMVAIQAMNQTSSLSVNNTSTNDDHIDEEESFYTVDVLLTADAAVLAKISQNDSGLSIRLTARDGTVTAWYRLCTTEDSNYFGQRSYALPRSTRNLSAISSVAIRVGKPELAASSMPYYLCVHGSLNSNSTVNENWSGCTYVQTSTGSKIGDEQQYPLYDASGKLA